MSEDGIKKKSVTKKNVKQQKPARAARQPRYFELDLLGPVYYADTETVEKRLADGFDVNMTDDVTGLSALHVAVGTNNLPLVKILVEKHHAEFFADRLGRWPSLIAAECQVDEALCDYIVEAEARFLEQGRSS